MAYSSFIANTYFVGEINIPNVSETGTAAALLQATTQYEKEILISLLGYKLYSLLIADCAGGTGLPVTQIYIDLVNGKEFTHNYKGQDYTIKWEGLKNSALQSLIAYYVFYKYVERDVTRLYGTGVSMAKAGEGWGRVSPMSKLINAWDRMRDLYGRIPVEYEAHWCYPRLSTAITQVYDMKPSAYNFLYANKDNYPDWIFTPQWNINEFNI